MQNSLTKKLGLSVAAMALAATSLFTASDAQAVPAFARQTGMSCSSCHYQSFPALNGMGRSFKAGGYTMKGMQASIEGERIDLPVNLNLALAWKTFYEKKSGATVGEILMPDEFAILAGGRMAANIGFLAEIGDLNKNESNFSNVKMQFNVYNEGGTTVAIIPFSGGMGAAYGFELMNTGNQASQRPLEAKRALNPGLNGIIGQAGSGTGVSFVAHNLATGWWVNYSLWAPLHSNDMQALDGGSIGDPLPGDPTGMAAYIRAGYFFDLAGFDSGVAIASRTGTAKTSFAWAANPTQTITKVKVAGNTVDFQMQGGDDFPLAIYLVKADAGTSPTTKDNDTYYAGYADGGASGLGTMLKYAVTPGILVHYASSSLTYGTASTKLTESSVGIDLKPSENVTFQIFQHSEKDGAADAVNTMVMGWFVAM